jgi:hypothetical protein
MVDVAVFDEHRPDENGTDRWKLRHPSAKSMFCKGNIAAANSRCGAALQKSTIQSL